MNKERSLRSYKQENNQIKVMLKRSFHSSMVTDWRRAWMKAIGPFVSVALVQKETLLYDKRGSNDDR